MSYREKVTWAGLVAALGVWGFYFATLIGAVRDGDATRAGFIGEFGGRFIEAIILITLVEIVLAIVIALTTPKAEQAVNDERERTAVLRSDSVAFGLLCVLLVGLSFAAYALGIGASGGRFEAPFTANAFVLMANGVLFCLLAADVTRYGARLWLLARGR